MCQECKRSSRPFLRDDLCRLNSSFTNYAASSMIATTSRSTSSASDSTPVKPVARRRSVGLTVAIVHPWPSLKIEIRQGNKWRRPSPFLRLGKPLADYRRRRLCRQNLNQSLSIGAFVPDHGRVEPRICVVRQLREVWRQADQEIAENASYMSWRCSSGPYRAPFPGDKRHSDNRHAEIGARFEGIAGQDAQPA